MAHGPLMKMVMGAWFVLGWGLAPGVLTWIVIHWAVRRVPRRFTRPVCAVAATLVSVAVCYPMYLYATDPEFMRVVMGAAHTGADHHRSHPMVGAVADFEVLLIPTLICLTITIATVVETTSRAGVETTVGGSVAGKGTRRGVRAPTRHSGATICGSTGYRMDRPIVDSLSHNNLRGTLSDCSDSSDHIPASRSTMVAGRDHVLAEPSPGDVQPREFG